MSSKLRLLVVMPVVLCTAIALTAMDQHVVLAATKPQPFKAKYAGTVSSSQPMTPPFFVTGSGAATVFGDSTNSGVINVTGPAPRCGSTPGFSVQNDEILTSSDDGDQITMTIADQSCQLSPGVFQGLGSYVITGGTGRFSGASGSGSFQGIGDFNTNTFSYVMTGTISVLHSTM